MRLPNPEEIARAEAQLAEVQSALDDVRRLLRGAERAERAGQKGMSVLRPVSMAAAGLALAAAVFFSLRGHSSGPDTSGEAGQH